MHETGYVSRDGFGVGESTLEDRGCRGQGDNGQAVEEETQQHGVERELVLSRIVGVIDDRGLVSLRINAVFRTNVCGWVGGGSSEGTPAIFMLVHGSCRPSSGAFLTTWRSVDLQWKLVSMYEADQ